MPAANPPAQRPNILFITCDQWRGDSFGAAGHLLVRTPNTDALAREGVMFTKHYASTAPCSPARACLYTGLYQMNTRVCRNGTPLDARHGNIALSMRALGYDPTLFGYSDTSPDPRLRPLGDPFLRTYEGVLPGFTVRVQLPEHQRAWLSWLAAQGVGEGRGFPEIHEPARGVGERVTPAPPFYSAEQTPGQFLAGEFTRWLGEQQADTPFFAHLSLLSPHPPFIVPAPYNTMYDAAECSGMVRREDRQAEASTHPWLAWQLGRQQRESFLPGMPGGTELFTEADLRQLRAIYYGMISETDAQLGRVWSALKAAGRWDDTIIVLTSDHAEMLGDHHLLGKGGFFDGSYHVPLIIRAPGSQNGVTIDRFTEAVDIMPTLLELAGAAVPQHLDGCSLAGFLRGDPPRSWRDAAHWEFDFRSIETGLPEAHFGIKPQQCNLAVIRTEKFKYVHFGGGLPPLLYDLANDPGELIDVAGDPRHAATRLDFAERLLSWRAEHLDQTLALTQLTPEGPVGSFAPLMPAILG